MQPLKVLLLLGSIRLGRQSHKAAYLLQYKLNRETGVDAELADLMDYPLPMMEERYGVHPDPTASVRSLGEKIQRADAMVFISPEYAGSYSGVLKNAVDYFGRQMSGKPIAVVATSAGRLGGINASHQLQHLILAIMAYPMPRKLLIPQVQDTITEDLKVTAEFGGQVTAFIGEFLEFARAITAKRQGTFRPPAPDRQVAKV
jgi:NAD(P)H-dependent FMN reductase